MPTVPSPVSGRTARTGEFILTLARLLAERAGRANLTMQDVLAGPRPRGERVRATRFHEPEESWVAPAGVTVPPDVRVSLVPEFSRGEGAAIGRDVLFGGTRVPPGQLAHELEHIGQARTFGPFTDALYHAIAKLQEARGLNPYTRHPFEEAGEKARFAYERAAETARAYQQFRKGERGRT